MFDIHSIDDWKNIIFDLSDVRMVWSILKMDSNNVMFQQILIFFKYAMMNLKYIIHIIWINNVNFFSQRNNVN